jgi:2-hydroxychromene-2-carboxylate isomerase
MKNANYIEFYFDCSSPWTYFAFTEILPLSKRQSLEILWKPVLVGGVFNSVNKDVYEQRKKPNPLKLKYYNDDLNLWARVRNIDLNFPKVFPVNSVKAMRGCLFADKENQLPVFAKNIFHSYWCEGIDISQEEPLLKIVHDSGLNPKEFMHFIKSQEAKDSLIQNTEELVTKKGFGSPTFFYKDQMFFGNDRLHLLEETIINELI